VGVVEVVECLGFASNMWNKLCTQFRVYHAYKEKINEIIT